MDTPRTGTALCALCYLLEDDAGALFLVPPASLAGCRVPEGQAEPFERFASGDDLGEADAAMMLHLLARTSGDDVQGLSLLAARRLRAWAVLRTGHG